MKKTTFLGLSVLLFLAGMMASGWHVHHFSLTALYLDYGHFGFVKRGLLGSLIRPLLPMQISTELARVIWVGMGVFFGVLTCFLISTVTRSRSQILLRCALISPALFLQAGFNFSFLDLLILLCFCLSLLILCESSAWHPWKLMALVLCLVAGALFHEVFIVAFVPCLVALTWRQSQPSAFFLFGIAVLVTGALLIWGSYEPGPIALQQKLAIHYVDIFKANTVELTSTFRQNLSSTVDALGSGAVFKSIPGIVYLSLLIRCVRARLDSSDRLLLCCCLTPLLLLPLATDSSRWIGFACANLLLMGLMDRLQFRFNRWSQSMILAFTLLGPLGIQGSFPLVGSALRRLVEASS